MYINAQTGDSKRNAFRKVREIVLNGILSPSVVMSKIPEIKNWRTAKKYIHQVLQEYNEYKGEDSQKEFLLFKDSLAYLKLELIGKKDKVKNLNQYIGLVKCLIKLNDQILKISNYSDNTKEVDNLKIWDVKITTIK